MADWPKMDKFHSPDEIVDILFERFKDSENVAEFIEHDPIMYHHGFGTGIRNEFWLWHPENPHTMKDYKSQLRGGVDYNPKHADNVSGVIVSKLHARLKAYYVSKQGTSGTVTSFGNDE